MTSDILSKQLSHLTDIEILGKPRPVKFLEGEVHLLRLRALYDRALDVLRDTVRYASRAYAENIVPYDGFKESVKKVIGSMNEALGLTLTFDEKYYDAYKVSLDIYHEIDTVYRLRRWLRYMIYQLMGRVQSGYVSDEEIANILADIKRYGRLTDEEVEFFATILTFIRSSFDRRSVVDAILKQLSKGLITKEQAKEILMKAGIDENVVDALIEVKAKTYTLSIGTYLAYADLVEIPTEVMEKKLELMGVPPDEKELIMEVFKLKPIKSEMNKFVSASLDSFENGYIDEKTLRENLEKLGLRKDSLEFLIAAKKVEIAMNKAKLKVDAILNRLRRGVMKLSDARRELEKVIVDKELIDALLEKNIRTYTFSVDKMISMSEYIPIDMDWIIEKARMFGYPEEEIKVLPAYKVARDVSEEIGRMATELGNDYVEGLLTDEEFKKALDDLATLGGEVKKLGVEWIVLSPEERAILFALYKMKKQRKQLS